MVVQSLHSIFAGICLVIYLLIVYFCIGSLVWIFCFKNLNLVIHLLPAFPILRDGGQGDAICCLITSSRSSLCFSLVGGFFAGDGDRNFTAVLLLDLETAGAWVLELG